MRRQRGLHETHERHTGPQGSGDVARRARLRRQGAVWLGMLAILLAAIVLSACGPDPAQAQAHTSKAKLDHEVAHAQRDLGIPSTMLASVTTQEGQVAAGDGGWGYNYRTAATRYDALYAQVLTIEQQSVDQLKQKTQNDVQALTNVLNERRAQGFNESDYYQASLDKALADFGKATTPGDYAKIDATLTTQIAALRALWPAYQKLQDFQTLLRTLHTAGVDTALSQHEYTQDQQAFHDPAKAHYDTLGQLIDGQIMQVMADQTEAMPYVGKSLLAAFQSRIDLLRQYGEAADAATFQQQHDADAKTLAAASQLADYLTFAQTLNHQTEAMQLPLLRGQAQHDLATLKALIATGQAKKVGGFPAAYEYANQERGYGDSANEVLRGKTVDDYLTADEDVNILLTNLRAMLDNLNDPTPHDKAHVTDLQLIQTYGFMDGKAIVVSLREQVARLYDNGQLVYTTNVTTGRPELPSPPGVHYAMSKQTHILFTSPDPAGSPFYYKPTPINYAILYANYGFFLHDAYWRRRFGPGSNLPHYDPAAFNGGSHGCINFPESNMIWVYNWTPVGSPIIVY